MISVDDPRTAYERAVAHNRKASPGRTSTLRKTEKLIAATMTMRPTVNAAALAKAAARHVHPRHLRRPAK